MMETIGWAMIQQFQTGTLKVWIVRVNFDQGWGIGENLTKGKNMNEINERYFGNENSLHATYQGCSAKKLGFTSATGNCPNFFNIDLPHPIVSNFFNLKELVQYLTPNGLSRAVREHMDKFYDECNHDIKILILPKGIRNTPLGRAEQKRSTATKKSYFNHIIVRDDYWDDVSTSAHEIAHGFAKPDAFSLQPKRRYNDHTDLLGNDTQRNGKLCFNAARYSSLGWFNTKQVEVDLATKSYTGYLVSTNTISAFTVEGKEINHDFIIKMKVADTYWYAMFSRAEGVTKDQSVYDNTVTVVQLTKENQNSFFVGAATKELEFKRTKGGATIVVKVCMIEEGPPEAALVIAYIEGKTDTTCPEYPSAAPTVSIQPSSSPSSKGPTKSPSPTFFPSDAPSLLPSSSEIEDYGFDFFYFPKICQDSASMMYFPYNKKKRACSWVTKNPDPEIIYGKCLQSGVKSHCPNSCDVCHKDYRCKDSEKKFLVNGIKRSCNWAKSVESKIYKRCNKPNVASTCRETCKFCSNDCSDNDSFKFTIYNGKQKGCSWLTRDPSRAEKRKDNWCPKVGQPCEATCGLCSTDTS